MKMNITGILALAGATLLTACSSNLVMDSDKGTGAPVYKYQGEKYGVVTVTPSAELAQDPERVTRLQELALDKAVTNAMIGNRIYDDKSPYMVEVVVNSFRFRSAFNAIMWGVMSGTDNIDGSVTLKDQSGKVITHFEITASYALGGFGGGPDGPRMSWMAGKFGELTAKAIQNKSSDEADGKAGPAGSP